MRRVLIAAVVALTFYGCEAQVRDCADQTDCFGGEVCRDGVCIASFSQTPDGAMPDTSGDDDAGSTDTGPQNCRSGDDPCGFRVCNVSTGLCEECQRDAQCDSGEICDTLSGRCICNGGFHECDGRCLSDNSADSCGTRCEPCPPADGGDAVCTAGTCDIECLDPFRKCSGGDCPGDRICIECEAHSECQAYDASRCVEGDCVACETSADCAHLDRDVCHDGVCVECAIGEAEACGDFSCNPATNECTTTTIGSLDWCDSCVADNECPPQARCIPMEYKGTPRPGGFCLEQADDGCTTRDTVTVQRESLSGIVGEFYCTIREDLTTCEAVQDFGRPCDQDGDCGVEGTDDGKCRMFDGDEQCTIPCVNSEECVFGTSCVGNPPNASYCARF